MDGLLERLARMERHKFGNDEYEGNDMEDYDIKAADKANKKSDIVLVCALSSPFFPMQLPTKRVLTTREQSNSLKSKALLI